MGVVVTNETFAAFMARLKNERWPVTVRISLDEFVDLSRHMEPAARGCDKLGAYVILGLSFFRIKEPKDRPLEVEW